MGDIKIIKNVLFWVFSLILCIFMIIIYAWIVSAFTGDFTGDDFVISLGFGFGFLFIPISFLFVYSLMDKQKKHLFESVIFFIGFILTTSINPAFHAEIYDNTVYDNVISGVFYQYDNGSINVSMYLLNQNDGLYFDEVIFTLSVGENNTYDVSIRNNGTDSSHNPATLQKPFVDNTPSDYTNLTVITFNEDCMGSKIFGVYKDSKDKPGLIFANFTIESELINTSNYEKVFNYIEIKIKSPKRDKPYSFMEDGAKYKLKLIPGFPKSDYKNLFNQIKNCYPILEENSSNKKCVKEE